MKKKILLVVFSVAAIAVIAFALTSFFSDARQGQPFFFEGFEDGDYAADPVWAVFGQGNGPISVTEEAAFSGNFGLRFSGNGAGLTQMTLPIGKDSIDAMFFVRASDVSSNIAAHFQLKGNGLPVAEIIIQEGKFKYKAIEPGYEKSRPYPFDAVPSSNIWYGLRIKYSKSAGRVSYYIYAEDGALIEARRDAETAPLETIDAILIESYKSSSTTDWDAFDSLS